MKSYFKYIKWVLMVLGAIRFNMFGAFAGFFIGIFFEELLEGNSNVLGDNTDNQERFDFKMTAYQSDLLSITGAILRTNKLISKNQSYYILKFFYRQFGTRNGKVLFAKLKVQVQNPIDYILSAQSLKEKHRESKHQIIRFLYGLCKVDRPMHADERRVLENIAKNIGMSKYDFEKIVSNNNYRKKTYTNKTTTSSRSSLQSHYFILGVPESSSEAEIKKAYRKLVLKYHPDKTSLSRDLAAEKFQEVQEAYDAIRSRKGIK